jgi:NACalpha-BTF3-like transcription factor
VTFFEGVFASMSGKKHDSGAGSMDRISNRDEEREVKAGSFDPAKVTSVVAKLQDDAKKKKENEKQLEDKLSKVSIDVKDIDIIAAELDIDIKSADRKLREHNGSVEAVISSLISE